LTEYEIQQIEEIRKWKEEEPSVVTTAVGHALAPIGWLINKVIPQKVIRGALDLSSSTAQWLTDTDDIIREAGVTSIADLKKHDLKVSDDLANSVHNWAIALALTEGALTGSAGIFGMAANIPIVITLALRTIHKIGVCYGYEAETQADKEFILSIMAASGANCIEEKVVALLALRSIEVTVAKTTFKKMSEKAASNQLGKEAAIIAVKNLAKQLGINLTKRKILQAIPVIGAGVGASVDGWYLKEVGWAARRAFQERWLQENKNIKIEDV